MGRSKRTPERSKLVRGQTPALSRRQRTPGDRDANAKAANEPEKPAEAKGEPAAVVPTSSSTDETMTEGRPLEAADIETQPITQLDAKQLPAIDPPEPGSEPWPDATPAPMAPVAPRTSTATDGMPAVTSYGRPPDMPRSVAPPPLALGDVENPTHMPGPREIPGGNPDDPAPAPGRVPPGDSRSFRRDQEFVLIYRVGTCVITRTGTAGTRGQWRVVEYPTSSAASNSYAKECSRFVSEGFSDYRD